MPRFSARPPNPDEITGTLSRYLCRTVDDVDCHLVILRARLPLLPTPQQVRSHREDIDLLLDRRNELLRVPR